jgi:ABC-type sugar transport system permease subunit
VREQALLPAARGADGVPAAAAVVAPLVAALLFLTVLPLAFAILVSFTDLRLNRLARWDWIGFEHYVRLAADARWWSTVLNGMIYIVIPTVLQMFLGLSLALLLHSAIRSLKAIRSLFILPMVLPPVVVGVLWKAFLIPDLGGLDYFMSLLGLRTPGFLETDLSASLSAENRSRIARRTPLGRLGLPADVVGAIDFLSSPRAGFITGQVLTVAGGM